MARRPSTRRTVTDAPTEPLAPSGTVTREYEEVERPGPPLPPERPPRAWYDEIGWALLGLLLLVGVGFLIWWFAFHDNTAKATVPAVTGQRVASAVDELQARGFKVKIVPVVHPEPRGTIFREIPGAGSRVDKGSTVQVLQSTGPAAKPVPNAVGLTEAAGRDRLVAAGFQVTEARVFSNDQPPGKIVAQNPAAGSKAGKGSTVRINVSKGTATVVVPDVVGMTLGEAETQIAKAGLKPVVQLRVPSAQPPGTVVAQNPPGGQAKRGSAVRLNVSTGSAASSGASGATGASGPTGASGATGATG
jgi:eukaryotic-like serine/threonine-protein kinase